MKKVFCFVFAVVISVLTFSSCLAEDAYGLYTTVMDSMKDVKAFAGSYEVKINVAAGDMSMGYTMDGDLQLIQHSETDMDMALRANLDLGSLLGGASNGLEMSVYYIDGWMYTNTNGAKEKEEKPLDELLEGLDSDDAEKLNSETFLFDRDWIVASDTAKVDGGKKIYFELDGDKIYTAVAGAYEEALDTELGDLSNLLGGLTDEDIDFTLGNFQYTVLVDKDNVMYGASIVCSIEMDEGYKIELELNLSDLAFDSITEIDVPEDLDTYSESGDWFNDWDDTNDYYNDDNYYYDGYDYDDLYDGDVFF